MKSIKLQFISLLLIFFTIHIYAQDTFSIVAVDTITGEIGGAGASCIDDTPYPGGVLIINDIIPARGAIHTQSFYEPVNQNNAHQKMVEGLSPQEIGDKLGIGKKSVSVLASRVRSKFSAEIKKLIVEMEF